MDANQIGAANSGLREKQCNSMMQLLWDPARIDPLFDSAIELVSKAIGGKWDRDLVHTITVTSRIIELSVDYHKTGQRKLDGTGV